MAARGRDGAKLIIRRTEETDHAPHHGGAWKVAYADFVTAMMIFFLMMWLLKAMSVEQRRGLADYFSPSNVFGRSTTGSGAPFGGRTPHDQGLMESTLGAPSVVTGPQRPLLDVEEDDSDMPAEPLQYREGGPYERPYAQGGPRERPFPATGESDLAYAHGGDYAAPRLRPPPDTAAAAEPPSVSERRERAMAERAALQQAAEQIRAAVRDDPALSDLAGQLAIDQTPEGLRLQILDEERQPMFATGSIVPSDRTRLLVQRIAPVLLRLPNAISIAGHTDAAPFRGSDRSNWELSTERALATRRLLVDAKLPESRIRSVSGNADRDLLIADSPLAAANRRIAIVVLRSATALGRERARMNAGAPQ